jgi:small GTP-binding protein
MQYVEQLQTPNQNSSLLEQPSLVTIPPKLKFIVLGAAGAGKTSLLRRYFYKQFEYGRMPTLGADFYVGRVPISTTNNNSIVGIGSEFTPPFDSDAASHEENTSTYAYINLQMWDTPGKENFALQHRRQQQQVKYSTSLSDSFVQHADAIMLVYDMTSSTSFTRLLKWYGDLIELFTKTKKSIPILIVANKLDLYNQGMNCKDQRNGAQMGRPVVAQRNVLGLHDIDYYGKNFRYEYQIVPTNDKEVAASAVSISSSNDVSTTNGSTIDDPLLSSKGTKRRMEISSYLVNRDNWTTDGSYLESLLHSEDGSHPDRDMVLLWCMRNRLQLVEISAATGEGVHKAVEALIILALENASTASNAETSSMMKIQNENRINDELDLHRRYSNKNKNCCFIFPSFRCCRN